MSDVGGDAVAGDGVAEDVGAEVVDESEQGLGAGDEGAGFEAVGGLRGGEAAVAVVAQDRDDGRFEGSHQLADLEVARGVGGGEAGDREEHVALEAQTLVRREREVDGALRGAFAQHRYG